MDKDHGQSFVVCLPDGKIIRIPAGSEDKIGYRVIVNLRNNWKDMGLVINKEESRPSEEVVNLYFPDEIPLISKQNIELCKLISKKYLCPLFSVLQLMIPSDYLTLEIKISRSLKSAEKSVDEFFKSARALKLFKVLKKKKRLNLRQARKFSSLEKLKKLEELGLIEVKPKKMVPDRQKVLEEFLKRIESAEKEETKESGISNEQKVLTDEQKFALERILKSGNRKFLIFGATGSGKTEVYIRAIKEEIETGGGAIFLVPEISLTTFLLGRIRDTFKDAVVLHSGIPQKERELNWWALRYGISRLAIGARSAVFSPIQNLKVIVVDEEHDPSYKQSPQNSNSPVFYDARDVAEMRATIENAKVIFGSATPSINNFYRAKTLGSIELIKMKKRIPGMTFPKNIVLDLKKEPAVDFATVPLTCKLKEEIEKRIEKAENIILLFTRRGYSISIICRNCLYKFKCVACSSTLVYHKNEGLVCHWCGRKYPRPFSCPNCGSTELDTIGFGTEKIEDELKAIFKVPVLRMDSDVVNSERKAKKILEEFKRNSPAILLGTQMVSKGFDFPKVSMVGVILIDTEFTLPAFNADERAFQLISQVSGRAGRQRAEQNNIENVSIIQTYFPEHPVIRYCIDNDYESFFEEEIEKRKEFGLPPFSTLVLVLFSHKNEELTWEMAKRFFERVKSAGIRCEMPTKSLRYITSSRYNVKMIIYIQDKSEFSTLARIFHKSVFYLKGVKITVDVNPENIL